MSGLGIPTGVILIAQNMLARVLSFGGGFVPVSEVDEGSAIRGNVRSQLLGSCYGSCR